jgi:hypothetical protein
MTFERFAYDVSEREEMAVDTVSFRQNFFSTGGHRDMVEMLCNI